MNEALQSYQRKYKEFSSTVFREDRSVTSLQNSQAAKARPVKKTNTITGADWKDSKTNAKINNISPSKNDSYKKRQEEVYQSNVLEQKDYSSFKP